MYSNHVTIPSTHFQKRIRQQYNNVAFAIAREAVQNSVDAGATKVIFHVSDDGHKLTVQDNGTGMSAQEFEQYFLTLGGTRKDTGSIGGFGAAKELLAFAWESWTITSRGFVCRGAGPTYEIQSSDNNAKGFRLTIQDDKLDFWFGDLYHLVDYSTLGKCRIILQCDNQGEVALSQRRKLTKRQVLKEYSSGTLFIVKTLNDNESGGNLYVRSKGLYTFCAGTIVDSSKCCFYLELQKPSPETLTESRESLRWRVKDEIQADVAQFAKEPAKLTETKLENTKHASYGIIPAGNSTTLSGYSHGTGSANMEPAEPMIWDRPMLIVYRGKKLSKLTAKQSRVLKVWTLAIDRLNEALPSEMSRGCYTGLTLTPDAAGCHTTANGRDVLCVNPSHLPKDAFNLLELAIHEYAHCSESDHCQEFESARMRIAQAIGYCYRTILHDLDKALKSK